MSAMAAGAGLSQLCHPSLAHQLAHKCLLTQGQLDHHRRQVLFRSVCWETEPVGPFSREPGNRNQFPLSQAEVALRREAEELCAEMSVHGQAGNTQIVGRSKGKAPSKRN
jgi:hypothetical protein